MVADRRERSLILFILLLKREQHWKKKMGLEWRPEDDELFRLIDFQK